MPSVCPLSLGTEFGDVHHRAVHDAPRFTRVSRRSRSISSSVAFGAEDPRPQPRQQQDASRRQRLRTWDCVGKCSSLRSRLPPFKSDSPLCMPGKHPCRIPHRGGEPCISPRAFPAGHGCSLHRPPAIYLERACPTVRLYRRPIRRPSSLRLFRFSSPAKQPALRSLRLRHRFAPPPSCAFGATTVVVMAADGQVTLGDSVIKHSARKIRRLYQDKILAGFAGSTADAFSLFSRFESKLEQYAGTWAAPPSNWPRIGAPTRCCGISKRCWSSPIRSRHS